MRLGSRTMAPTDGEPSPYVLKEVFQVGWQTHGIKARTRAWKSGGSLSTLTAFHMLFH